MNLGLHSGCQVHQPHPRFSPLAPCKRNTLPLCRNASGEGSGNSCTSCSQQTIDSSHSTSSTALCRIGTDTSLRTTSRHDVNRRSFLSASAAVAATVASATSLQAIWGCRAALASLVDEAAAQSVFALASRSVVSINDYRSQAGADILEGIGTGFVWDQYGHIVTNYHVISKYVLDKSGKQSVKVKLGEAGDSLPVGSSGSSNGSSSDGGGSSTFQARVIGTDAMHDLAVLAIDAPRDTLVPIRVGTSADLKVGQSVYAIGNPSGLSKTLTAGVVSGLNRTIPAPTGTRIYGAIQTDATINAGNSGGPLLDSFGRLVGVNTASFTRSGTGRGSGVNFALPADLVRSVVPNLIIYGTAAGKGVRSG